MTLDNFQKLIVIRKKLGLSQGEMAIKLNIAQPNYCSMEKGKRIISQKTIYKVNLIVKKEIGDKTYFLNNLYESIDILPSNDERNLDSNVASIPFYEIKASAGAGEELIDYPDKQCMYFDKRWLENILGANSNYLSIIQAKGDSMEPQIKDGDLLIVDTSQITGNGIFVFKVDDVLKVKKLNKDFMGNLEIISNNPKYPIEVISVQEQNRPFEIIGKVIWNGSKENI